MTDAYREKLVALFYETSEFMARVDGMPDLGAPVAERAGERQRIFRDAFIEEAERADNGALGSSKVQDMRKLAQEALDE